MQFIDLKWEAYPGVGDKPGYSETDVSALFENLLWWEGEYLRVTIRKYPRRYFIAYEYDEDDRFNWDYTQNGEGDGIVPGFSIVYVWARILHEDLEAGFQQYISQLRAYLSTFIGLKMAAENAQ